MGRRVKSIWRMQAMLGAEQHSHPLSSQGLPAIWGNERKAAGEALGLKPSFHHKQ